jgi:hypothetical protein
MELRLATSLPQRENKDALLLKFHWKMPSKGRQIMIIGAILLSRSTSAVIRSSAILPAKASSRDKLHKSY